MELTASWSVYDPASHGGPEILLLMRASIALVADDLTGAADAGVGLAKAGLVTDVRWLDEAGTAAGAGTRADSVHLPVDNVQVLAVDTGSRKTDAAGAARLTAQVVSYFKSVGVATLYKKIDSTLRGHVGEEIAAALTAWHPWSMAIVAPAFPAMRRQTIGGELRVDGVASGGDGSIVRRCERAGLRTVHIDLGRVRGGTVALSLRDALDRGVRAVVCDAETDADLDAIASAGASTGSRIVWVASGGLAQVLPRHLPVKPNARPGVMGMAEGWGVARRSSPDDRPAPVLIVVGSRTSAARQQVAHLAAAGVKHIAASAGMLRADRSTPADSARAAGAPAAPACAPWLDSVVAALAKRDDVVVTIEGGDGEGPGPEDASLPAAIGHLLRPVAGRIGGLVLTGGDTALGVLRAWEVTSLRLVAEVEPGLPWSWSAGAVRLPVVTKAGGFGGARALLAARDRLRALADAPDVLTRVDPTRVVPRS
jgi:4-hydroxythreonine-4-phosphate dehydrogenase